MAARSFTNEGLYSLEQSLSLLKTTLESSNDGILVVNHKGEVIDYNQKFMTMWRVPRALLETRDESKIIIFLREQIVSGIQEQHAEKHDEIQSIDILKLKDGRIVERYAHPHKLNDQITGRVWCFRDITSREKLAEELHHHMTHDSLTSLPNRLLLFDRLRQEISIAKGNHKIFALLVFDLDRFKAINDSLTLAVGDELLRIIAKRLEGVIHLGDNVARIGGDEFAIVLSGVTDENQTASIARHILDIISHPYQIAGREITITASMGISVYPKDGEIVDMLLGNADTAMHRAKEHGANSFEFYTTEMNRNALARLEKEMQLRKALTSNQLVLHYQPQLNMLTGEVMGAEALLRWQHPEKGLLYPSDFISLAEETGLIVPIGEWVMKTACQQAKLWQESGYPDFRVAVNVATEQFKQQNLVETISKVLKQTKLEPQYLEIEISENVIINTKDIIDLITNLKQLGVTITLDDFGTGCSSLSNLKKIPLQRLKIDRSFLQNVPNNHDDVELAHAIIAMGKAFRLEIMAEGVETQEQIDFLKAEKCSDVQGFYYSKPLPPNELEKFLAKNIVGSRKKA